MVAKGDITLTVSRHPLSPEWKFTDAVVTAGVS